MMTSSLPTFTLIQKDCHVSHGSRSWSFYFTLTLLLHMEEDGVSRHECWPSSPDFGRGPKRRDVFFVAVGVSLSLEYASPVAVVRCELDDVLYRVIWHEDHGWH